MKKLLKYLRVLWKYYWHQKWKAKREKERAAQRKRFVEEHGHRIQNLAKRIDRKPRAANSAENMFFSKITSDTIKAEKEQ